MRTDRIGIALWSLGGIPDEAALRRSLQTTVEIGIKGVQPWCVGTSCVLDPDQLPAGKRPAMKRLFDSYGVTISGFCAQLSGPTRFGGLDEEAAIVERIDRTCRCLEVAADLGAPIVTTHPGAIPEDESDPRYGILLRSISEIARHGEKVGGIFCIETGQESAETLKRFLEHIGSTALQVNYDPANMLGWGTVEGVETLAPWIVHTHAKDHDPVTKKATLGEGKVPWDGYLSALRGIGYDGWLAIEDETGGDVTASIRRGYTFLKEKLAGT